MKKTTANKLTLLFCITYTVSYITRINYGAIISEMMSVTGFSKQELSLGLTVSFITYGIGQILSGILGDKFSPKKILLIGLITTVLMNLLLPFVSSYRLMAVIWGVNGLAQAFMWPPIVKIMLLLLDGKEYSSSVVKVCWGSSIGTIIIYLISPLIIGLVGWRGVFFFSAACGICMIFAWITLCPNPDISNIAIAKDKPKVEEKSKTRIFTPAFFVLCMVLAICGMLRDGVATWTPSLISESFNLSNSVGILSGAVLPIFAIICNEGASFLYRKKFKSPVMCGGVIFSLGAASAFLLMLVIGKSSVASLFAIALLNGAMHGVNLMLTGMIPAFYKNTGRVSVVSGSINAFVYVGSAISTYGIALLTERFDWNFTVIVWMGLAILGAVISFLIAPKWRKA